MASPKQTITELLKEAGITVNGKKDGDIQVHDERFYTRILAKGSLGAGESYMDGWWDAKKLDVFFTKVLRERLDQNVLSLPRLATAWLRSKLLNMQSKRRAAKSIKHHYDIGNDLYERMLDETMTYSCGYWKNAKNLKEAQEAKYDLICRKVGLEKGMRVLDIGCGWGGFCEYAARKYGASVVGVTISKAQAAYAKKRCKDLDVEIRLQDYRELDEQFDAVVSIGMFEHVGLRNHKTFMRVAHKALKEDGLFCLHTIGSRKSTRITDPWINKYIFPHGCIPSVKQIAKAAEGKFVMEDWHNFGPDYDKTLMAWHKNFEKAWPELKDKYGEQFYRMWNYYLLACAGSFRARKNQLWQVVYSKNGVLGGYETVR